MRQLKSNARLYDLIVKANPFIIFLLEIRALGVALDMYPLWTGWTVEACLG